MKAKLIKSNIDYEQALQRVDILLSKEVSADEKDELELLLYLIEVYEEEAFPINLPSPVDAILFTMEQLSLKQQDLVPYIGSKSKVSEIINGKRELSLSMIRSLHTHLGIPLEILIQEKVEDVPVIEQALA